MTDPSGGHWKSLQEAQKLTQATRIPGVFEEDIKRNNPIDLIPVAQAAGSGLRIEWLREKTQLEDAVLDVDIGEQLVWTEDVEYDEVYSELKRVYIQRKLDHFVESIYSTFNNFKAQKLLECEKGLKRKLGSRLVYADTTYGGAKQFDGFHALAAEVTSSSLYPSLNIDNAHAGLSLSNLRKMIDAMKLGCDLILAPYEVLRNLDAAYQEKGFAGLAYNVAGSLAFLSMGLNELGKRVLFWDAIPIARTDFLVAEQVDTGLGSDARAVYSSGTKYYSIFGLKWGNVMEKEPGVCFAWGGTGNKGDLYKVVVFPELEDFDAGGIRLVTYGTVLLSSKPCLSRIVDIADAAVVV